MIVRGYAFEPLGVCEVRSEDVDYILGLVSRGGGCCGSSDPGGRAYFVLED